MGIFELWRHLSRYCGWSSCSSKVSEARRESWIEILLVALRDDPERGGRKKPSSIFQQRDADVSLAT
jgi:hypothetical protein